MRRSRIRFTVSWLMIAVTLVAAILGIVSAKRRMDLFRKVAAFHDMMVWRYDRLATDAESERERLRSLVEI